MDLLNYLGFIIGVIGLVYAYLTNRQFSKGIKIGSLQHIRILINRMEEDKSEHQKDSPQWKTMHHTQQDLESLFKTLQSMFGITDSEAPIN